MKKIAVIYWSGTGNTEAMAKAVAEGIQAAGASAELMTAAQADAGTIAGMDAIALGCPAMGAEVLEESEFEPMFNACKPALAGKPIALFGSYGWGDGEWMRNWEADCDASSLNRVCESVICCEVPDESAVAACEALGKTLAEK